MPPGGVWKQVWVRGGIVKQPSTLIINCAGKPRNASSVPVRPKSVNYAAADFRKGSSGSFGAGASNSVGQPLAQARQATPLRSSGSIWARQTGHSVSAPSGRFPTAEAYHQRTPVTSLARSLSLLIAII